MFASLFVPATDGRKIRKAATLAVREIVLDLEDGVAASAKDDARMALAAAAAQLRAANRDVCVRINALTTPHWRDDLAAALDAGVLRLVVPKLESLHDYEALDSVLDARDPARRVHYSVLFETAAAVAAMDRLIVHTPRLRGISLGLADLCADLGTSWQAACAQSPPLFLSAREQLALLARANGLERPWDAVWLDIADGDGLKADAQIGRRLGYGGKSAIHPSQVAIINAVYAPTADELARAGRIVAAFDRASADGIGAVKVDGLMIDEPVVRDARRTLAAAEA